MLNDGDADEVEFALDLCEKLEATTDANHITFEMWRGVQELAECWKYHEEYDPNEFGAGELQDMATEKMTKATTPIFFYGIDPQRAHIPRLEDVEVFSSVVHNKLCPLLELPVDKQRQLLAGHGYLPAELARLTTPVRSEVLHALRSRPVHMGIRAHSLAVKLHGLLHAEAELLMAELRTNPLLVALLCTFLSICACNESDEPVVRLAERMVCVEVAGDDAPLISARGPSRNPRAQDPVYISVLRHAWRDVPFQDQVSDSMFSLVRLHAREVWHLPMMFVFLAARYPRGVGLGTAALRIVPSSEQQAWLTAVASQLRTTLSAMQCTLMDGAPAIVPPDKSSAFYVLLSWNAAFHHNASRLICEALRNSFQLPDAAIIDSVFFTPMFE